MSLRILESYPKPRNLRSALGCARILYTAARIAGISEKSCGLSSR
jgi:hypothetical protein